MVRIASRVLRDAHRQWRRLIEDERGSIILLAVWLPVLAGAVAIGIETGELYRVKREMQSAADAAALAGAIDSMASRTSSITNDAKYEAQRNGFTDNGDTVTVAVNSPPTSGPNVRTNNAVEAIIHKKVGAGLLGSLGTFTLSARSVAAPSTYTQTGTPSAEGCLVAMTTANEQGVSFTNFSSFASDCTIVSNASANGSGTSASINISNFSSATLKQIWTRGSVTVQNYSSITYKDAQLHPPLTAPLVNQTSYAVDPYAGIGPINLPSGTGNCDYNNYSAGNASTITVTGNKIYCNGLQVSNASTVNFTPGVYYIAGGDLYISSVSTVSCPSCTTDNGVAFVLTQLGSTTPDAGIGGVSISSDSTINLNAGKNDLTYVSGSTNLTFPHGILFYQDPRVTVGTMGSTSKIFTVSSLSNATLTGAIYFPNNRIDISNISTFGGSSTTGCTIWLGRYLKFSNFSSTYKGGCATYGTQPVTITSTTSVTKGKVLE
ncbi:MAG TPA: pilus assembly protein TadG-related protein [Reyranella sp.]|jgi:Flp pilus assembly protein TadG